MTIPYYINHLCELFKHPIATLGSSNMATQFVAQNPSGLAAWKWSSLGKSWN